ncbi:MAG: tetratricopeptide repeat protein [Flavobacteriaceae bacterium]
MATYKKRGNKIRKPKLNNDDYLSDVEFDGESSTQEIFDSLDETASKSEEWVEKNQKIIYTVLGLLLFSLLAYLAYGKFISGPKEIKAADQLAFSKTAFTAAESAVAKKDSLYNVALNGVDNQFGLLKISEKYSGTKAGNMANHMAGMAYLKMDKYENAIKYLNKFSSTDAVLGPTVKGKIGDAFADINQLDDAYDYYKQALNLQNNSLTTPLYLFKAANTAMEIGKFDEALKMFQRIKNSYPKSEEAKSIGVYINRAKYASR